MHNSFTASNTPGRRRLRSILEQLSSSSDQTHSKETSKEIQCQNSPAWIKWPPARHEQVLELESAAPFLSIPWIALLTATSGIARNTWFLFGAGVLGLFWNIVVSARPRDPEVHGFFLVEADAHPPLVYPPPASGPQNQVSAQNQPSTQDQHSTQNQSSTHQPGTAAQSSPRKMRFGYPEDYGLKPKVKQVLLEAERCIPGAGHSLRKIFFPGWEQDGDKQDWSAPDVRLETINARSKLASRSPVIQQTSQIAEKGLLTVARWMCLPANNNNTVPPELRSLINSLDQSVVAQSGDLVSLVKLLAETKPI
ncbi:hypothetical protein DM02DRAFT_621678 [Periconia macrospinosa]|uniref:Uncharacterized protein n=1 Tax=Periconia macrospinosa TaxID=97972 RepID=A0A2V1EBZ9_9PLEO|nr:hypothetical protein DM02DRAFT_621678 [Periconia macrospinosa]